MLPASTDLLNLNQYLHQYPKEHAAAFEYLIASAFSQIFYLPFQSKDTINNKEKYRVIWYGKVNKNNVISKSPSGVDSICFAYRFYILIECSLRFGANQWRKEFIESLKHYKKFIKSKKVSEDVVFLTIVVPKLHKDTFTGFQQKAKEGLNIILLESPFLAKIVDTAKLISTIRHLDLRQLLKTMVKQLRESTSCKKFKINMRKYIIEWHEEILKRERNVFFGLKAYEAIKKVGKHTVATSDILVNLNRDHDFNYYLKVLGGDPKLHIKDGLLSERLACLIIVPEEEDFFCKVDSIDFKERGLRLIKNVEKIDG